MNKDEMSLNREKIENTGKLGLETCFKHGDNMLSLAWFGFLLAILYVFRPPVFEIIMNDPSFFLIFTALNIVILAPPIIVDLIWSYRKKKGKSTKWVKALSYFAFVDVPAFLLFYFPTSLLELFWWIVTVFCLYVRSGREWAPLIRFSNALSTLRVEKYSASKRIVKEVIPSIYSFLFTFSIVCIPIILQFYPVPFLLIYFIIKYLFRKKYFYDFSDDVFYKNWDSAGKTMLKFIKVLMIGVPIFMVVFAILFPSTAF